MPNSKNHVLLKVLIALQFDVSVHADNALIQKTETETEKKKERERERT